MKERLLLPLLIVTAMLLASSCASLEVMARAEGVPGPLADESTFVSNGPRPAYYALLPLVFPFDVLTFPGQFVYFQMIKDQ